MIVVKQMIGMGEVKTFYRYKVDGICTNEDDDGNVDSVLVVYQDGTNERINDVISVEVL